MFPKDRFGSQLSAFFIIIGAFMLAGVVAFVLGVPSGASATDNLSYLFMLLFMVIPAMFLYFATQNGEAAAEKEKNKRDDPTFEKPKRDDNQFALGADGELIPLFEDEDEIEPEQGRR